MASNEPATKSTTRSTAGFRVERDGMGELQVPADALWGAQTQRAIENFRISGLTMPRAFIRALGLIKWAAAAANAGLGELDPTTAEPIKAAALAVADGKFDLQFPIDVFQTGSATSTNMNANEVIAHVALGRTEGVATSGPVVTGAVTVHPNDDVNRSQSSNDVIPSAIHLSAALLLAEELLPALTHLASTIEAKMQAVGSQVKTGRTHLMDAMPVTFAQELSGWAGQIRSAVDRLRDVQPRLHRLPLGGTAVGTGINAPAGFGARAIEHLAAKTQLPLSSSPNFFESLSSQDTAVELSGQLKTLAVALMKIANDLRWMNSGPLAGLAEIALPALQPGSSIMPGKVNPVIPEAVAMVAAQVIGNDATITVAGQAGNFQLNVMLPVVAYNLLQSLQILTGAARALADKAMAGFTLNTDRIEAALSRNPILITALNPLIGYEKGAAIAKQAYAEGRPVLDVAAEMTDLSPEELRRLLDPRVLTQGGVTTAGGGGG